MRWFQARGSWFLFFLLQGEHVFWDIFIAKPQGYSLINVGGLLHLEKQCGFSATTGTSNLPVAEIFFERVCFCWHPFPNFESQPLPLKTPLIQPVHLKQGQPQYETQLWLPFWLPFFRPKRLPSKQTVAAKPAYTYIYYTYYVYPLLGGFPRRKKQLPGNHGRKTCRTPAPKNGWK